MALSMLEIPFPEDDDMSDDEFDGPADSFEDADSDVSEDAPPIPDFQQLTGPSVDMTDKSPLDFFKLSVTDAMLDHIVEQTNIYAQQYIETATLPPHSRVHGWNKKVHNRAELKEFLAMIITMGLVNYPQVEDYWATCWPYATPSLSKVLHHTSTCTCTCTCACACTCNSIIIISMSYHKIYL